MGIGAIQCLTKVSQRQAIAGQPDGIRTDGIFFDIATVHVHARQPWRRAHARGDNPVLNRAKIGGAGLGRIQTLVFRRQIAAVRLPAGLTRLGGLGVERFEIHCPHQDFAQTRGDRGQIGFDPFRQLFLGLRHPFGHLLAGEIDVCAVREDDRHLAEAVTAERARTLDPRNTRHGGFQRISDLPLHLLGGEGRGHGVDLDLTVGDVRHRVDRQLGQLEQTPRRHQCGGQHDEPANADRRVDDMFKHD